MTLQVKRLTVTATMPTRAYEYDAGIDLYADEDVTLMPGGQSQWVRTGVALAIDPGKVGLVWPRSGLDGNHDITTGAGVVDAGFRGELKVLLRNHSGYQFGIRRGDKIAQLVLTVVCPDHIIEVDSLDETERGAAGFGSSGG
jgi:dUTP pyrophosphatase